MSDTEIKVKAAEPLTEHQLDVLSYVAVSSGIIGTVCFFLVFAVSVYVAVRTKVPGRFEILASILLLISLTGYEQYMGGNLEWVFGPVADLYIVIGYCLILLVFTVGYLRASKCFMKSKSH